MGSAGGFRPGPVDVVKLTADVETSVLGSVNNYLTASFTQNASSSLTPGTHKALMQLIHFIDDGPGDGFFDNPYREQRGFPLINRVTWWDSPMMNRRLYQSEYTRSVGSAVASTVNHKLYNDDGTLAITATDAITYVSGVFETSRTRSFS